MLINAVLKKKKKLLARLYDEKRRSIDVNKRSNISNHWTDQFDRAAGDSRRTWKLFKEVLFNNRDQEESITVSINGIQLSNAQQDVNRINHHFSTAGSDLAKEIIDNCGYDTVDI